MRQHLIDGLWHAIECLEFVERSVESTLGRCSIVASDVDDDGVIEDADLINNESTTTITYQANSVGAPMVFAVRIRDNMQFASNDYAIKLRGETIAQRQKEYVQAARAIGAGDLSVRVPVVHRGEVRELARLRLAREINDDKDHCGEKILEAIQAAWIEELD